MSRDRAIEKIEVRVFHMEPESVMKHKTRKMVYNYISAHPGAAFGTIQSVFDLTVGTLRYHLGYLEKHRLLTSRLNGGHKCYYPTNDTGSGLGNHPGLDMNTLTEPQKTILDLIQQRPGIQIGELETSTGLDRRVIQYNLERLRGLKIVWKVGNGRNTRYEYVTNERLREDLAKLLMVKFLNDEIDEETYLVLKGQVERERLR